MNYEQAWQFLDQLQFFKIKLGLDSMRHFLDRVGNPQRTLRCIHIAGTNGKGSVGAALHAILAAAGLKAGFYTSPHLSNVRERFKIGSAYIGKADFARLIAKIAAVLDGSQITYFECATVLALLWFAEQNVDIAVLEVGMGGRLDATNVITPLISLITNVSMDHEQHLGSTLAQIAAEKAGIIKPKVPVISGVADDDSGKVIRQTCIERQAPLFLLGLDFAGSSTGRNRWQYCGWDGLTLTDLPKPLAGEHQIGNLALALAAVQLLHRQDWRIGEEQIRSGLAQTSWPCRLEYFRLNANGLRVGDDEPGLCFLLDGAHNPAGVASLKQALRDFPCRRLILVWGAMADKDLHSTLHEIAPAADRIIFTQAESQRSAAPEQLLAIMPAAEQHKAVCAASLPEALAQARAEAAEDDLICVAGSLYLVGAARRLLLGELVPDEG